MPCTKCTFPFARAIIAALAGFIFVYLFIMIVHGHYLGDMYQQNIKLWRTGDEMRKLFPYSILTQFACVSLTVGVIAIVRNRACALILGVVLGLLSAIHSASTALFMPIPKDLALAWFGTTLFENIILVLIMSFIIWGRGCKIGFICNKGACES